MTCLQMVSNFTDRNHNWQGPHIHELLLNEHRLHQDAIETLCLKTIHILISSQIHKYIEIFKMQFIAINCGCVVASSKLPKARHGQCLTWVCARGHPKEPRTNKPNGQLQTTLKEDPETSQTACSKTSQKALKSAEANFAFFFVSSLLLFSPFSFFFSYSSVLIFFF